MKITLLFCLTLLTNSTLFAQDTISVYIFDSNSRKLTIYNELRPKKKTVKYEIVKNYFGERHHIQFELIKHPGGGKQIYFWIADKSFPYLFMTRYFIDLSYEPDKVIFVHHDPKRKNRYRFVGKWVDKDFKFRD